VRNSFLQAVFELRNGLPGGTAPRTTSPDVIRAMSTEQWLDFVGISMDPKKAEGIAFTMNLVTPDNGEQYAVELSNATLTAISGYQVKNPNLTVTVKRADLNQVMMGQASFDDLIKGRHGHVRGRLDRIRAATLHPRPIHAQFRDPAGHRGEEARASAEAVRGTRPRRPDGRRLNFA
jgi:alkyl sulfatase BDS1-like metallo-beta-lactamase superfamily hydrolase